jgi:hypothetical protein
LHQITLKKLNIIVLKAQPRFYSKFYEKTACNPVAIDSRYRIRGDKPEGGDDFHQRVAS